MGAFIDQVTKNNHLQDEILKQQQEQTTKRERQRYLLDTLQNTFKYFFDCEYDKKTTNFFQLYIDLLENGKKQDIINEIVAYKKIKRLNLKKPTKLGAVQTITKLVDNENYIEEFNFLFNNYTKLLKKIYNDYMLIYNVKTKKQKEEEREQKNIERLQKQNEKNYILNVNNLIKDELISVYEQIEDIENFYLYIKNNTSQLLNSLFLKHNINTLYTNDFIIKTKQLNKKIYALYKDDKPKKQDFLKFTKKQPKTKKKKKSLFFSAVAGVALGNKIYEKRDKKHRFLY